MVVVEVIVVEAHCYICCTFGVIVTDGAMYTGVQLEVLASVVGPSIIEWKVVDALVGVVKPNFCVYVGQVFIPMLTGIDQGKGKDSITEKG